MTFSNSNFKIYQSCQKKIKRNENIEEEFDLLILRKNTSTRGRPRGTLKVNGNKRKAVYITKTNKRQKIEFYSPRVTRSRQTKKMSQLCD